MAIAVRGVCPLLEVFDMPRSITFYRDVLFSRWSGRRSPETTVVGRCTSSMTRCSTGGLHRVQLEANWANMKAGRALDRIAPLE
jgi:hypothetical protein